MGALLGALLLTASGGDLRAADWQTKPAATLQLATAESTSLLDTRPDFDGPTSVIIPTLDLLIIAPEVFSTQAERLADWKRARGFKTEVALLDAIEEDVGGLEADDIRAFIQDHYRRLSLDYVILLGDVESIPTHYRSVHTTHDVLIGTDLYYAEMDDAGYYPDLSVGRLSVDTPEQADTVVDKIINYEQHPPWSTSFYRRALFVSYFEDWTGPEAFGVSDGKSDNVFVREIEKVRTYLKSSGVFGELVREYITNHNSWPDDPDFEGPTRYLDGTPVPADLRWPDFAWDGSAQGIVETLNRGALLTLYISHGKEYGWYWPKFMTYPYFDEPTLYDLDNAAYPTVVLSFACRTGWFDHETDQELTNETPYNDESFAEELLRLDGGAVAVVAASRNSKGQINEAMAQAFIDGLWGGMLPDYPGPGSLALRFTRSKRLGDVLNYAKMYVAETYGNPDEPEQDFGLSQIMFEVFNLLGDPTMELAKSPFPSVALPTTPLKVAR